MKIDESKSGYKAKIYDDVCGEAQESAHKVCSGEMMTAEQADKLRIHKELTDKIHHLYETKNMDYGDSMHPLFEEYGLTAFLVLFGIKIQRIKNLSETGNKQHYESIADSLYDLANYALIAITELKAKEYKELKDILNKSND